MAFAVAALCLGAVLGGASPPAAAADRAALQEAAALYHQGRFDSARVRLVGLMSAPGWRRRDSLVMLQYLGMSEARLGADSAATASFAGLLAADSLFRFPRNEDAAVLRTFQAARDRRAASAPASPEPPPARLPPAEDPADAAGAMSAVSAPDPGASRAGDKDPLAAFSSPPPPPVKMSLALGAVPLGGGWLARRRTTQGLALGFLQAGGILLSVYASERQNARYADLHGMEPDEVGGATGWQWVQRISLTTAMGAYLYSLIASGGD